MRGCVDECSWCVFGHDFIDVVDAPGAHGWSFHTGMGALTLTFCVLCVVLRTFFLRFISGLAKVSAFV